jgi:N4-gp56 family major capsid protein
MADTQCWTTAADGGSLANPRLSKQLRYSLTPLMKFRQFCDIKEAWGKGEGDTLYWNKISRINTAGGTLSELSTIAANRFTIRRGTITLSEWGNSIPYTGKLEDLAQFNLDDPIQRTLRDDMAITLDKAAGLQFKKTTCKYISTTTAAGNFETCATSRTVASNYISKGGWRLVHVRDCVKKLKQMNIPPYDDSGNYICIASVNFLFELMKDSDWKNAVYYGDPERIFAGEVGRIAGVRFIEETNYLANTLGSASGDNDHGEAVIFGKEAVIEGVAIPEELRAKIPTDYGRSKGVAWYSICGFKKMWDREDIAAQGGTGKPSQWAHIIHLTSRK